MDHAFDLPGRYIVTVVVTNDRGQRSGALLEIYVRGPGSKQTTLSAETGGNVPCPDTPETITVTVGIRVPSWAAAPFSAGFTIPSGGCPGGGTGSTNPGVTASWG